MPDTLQKYEWSGINKQGNRDKGIIQAADVKDAQSELSKLGIEVISLNSYDKKQLKLFSRKKKVKTKDIVLFTRYMSTMLSAGLTIIQGLDIISKDQENSALRAMVVAIKNNVSSGKTLSESFGQYPQHFNELYVSLVRAGEKSGTLDKMLNRLGTYLEKTESLKKKVKKALVYPTAILCVALIVSLILLLFVVPQFQKMFSSFGAQLPIFTRMVVTVSNFLRGYGMFILPALIILIFGIRSYVKKNESAKASIDRGLLKLIIIGPVLKKSIIARFVRTLSTTLEAGMPIVDSMRTMAPVMGSRLYSKGITKIADDIVRGVALSTAINDTKLFPNMVVQMVSVGESSGSLSDMLNKIADYYEEEVNMVVDNLSSLLEPLIMLVLGVIIGGFVIAMYLPIFKIGSIF